MAELTKEQQRAIAIASARMRMQANEVKPEAEYMSGPQRFLAGAGKAFSDLGVGAGQLLRSATNPSQVMQAAGVQENRLADKIGLPTEADVTEMRKRDAPLMETGAGMAGNLTGNVATLLPTAFVPGANTYTGAALIGGLSSALQPAESVAERLTNTATGAIVAPAALGAVRGVGNVASGLRAAAQPMTEGGQKQIVGNLLRRSAGDNADEAMVALRNAQPLIPGSQPTAAQVANSGGIAALERAASAANPEAYASRGVEQNMARLNALRAIAGNEGQMQAAKAARTAAAEPLYKAARETGVDQEMAKALQPQIKNLMDRMPAGVLDHAKELARINGEVLDGAGSINGLHYAKKAIDDMLSRTGDTGMGKISRRALQTFQGDLLATIDELSPLYAKGRQAFAAASPPINQMQVGQALLNKLEPALSQGNTPVRMNAEAFARALREGDTLAQKATGFKGATLQGTMAPEQIATLAALRDDLARSGTAANLGRGVGSNTFQNLAQENLMQASGISSLPQLLSRPVQMANYGLRSIYGSANQDMQRRLAQALLNPQETASLMEGAIPSQRAQMIADAMRRAQSFIPAAGGAPVLTQQ